MADPPSVSGTTSGSGNNDSGSSKNKGKGKPMPAEGSANPSASFASLWNYIEPALDHIVRSPTNNTDRAPSIDVAYHMGIHTAVYNYFTSAGRFGVDALAAPRLTSPVLGGSGSSLLNGAAGIRPPSPPGSGNAHGADLYEKLDKYYSEVCLELLASAPVDDSNLLHYLLPCWKRYHAGTNAVHRLLNYVNRHYVKRAVEEDRGWLRLADILDAVAQAIEENQPREHLAARLREKRLNELKRWGYTEDNPSPDALARAEAAAEAASPTDRIVPLSSMANRRFREVVIKPLLAVPKMKKIGSTAGGGGKKKYRKPPNPNNVLHSNNHNSSADAGPKSRLARAVKELIESKDPDTLEERFKMAQETNEMLGTVGIPVDHALRKKLDKFLLRPKGSG